jgi:hypothetical protein
MGLRRALDNDALADGAALLDLETACRRLDCEVLEPTVLGFCARVGRRAADAVKRRTDK